ncbi:MAG: MG2 domain-containing protein [Acidobacteriota bacterium]
MRRIAVLLSLLSLVVLPWAINAAVDSLKIIESEMRASIQTESIEVSLAVENSGKAVTARLRVELVDPQNKARARWERDTSLIAGANRIAASLSLSDIGHIERQELLWYRVRYRIDSTEGIVSLSEITPDLFELKILSPHVPVGGEIYRVVARAIHPAKFHPVRGVAVETSLKVSDDDKAEPLKASAVTDKNGYAVFEFRLPKEIASSGIEIKVEGRMGGISQTATDDVRVESRAWITISPDKPIYQPGQTLHVRLLARDFTSGRAIADAPLIVKISDPENTLLFRQTVSTSRFGVASFDWPIPQSARLGQYVIDVDIEEGEYERSESHQVIRVSRYDLPNFTVIAKSDRPYYLPGQNAEVEVRADYIFGEPVKNGRARVVRESSREWNYREQKWEVEEGDHYEGPLDQSNRFIAKVNLEEDHSDLADNDYGRMRDLRYAAYVTDLMTGRTERRLLDIRITRDPIHVYLIQANNRQAKGFPMQFYVSTFYADGSPAQCEVEIYQRVEANMDQTNASRGKLLRKIKTNRYGLAKVKGLIVDSKPEFELIARDREGRKGSETEDWWYLDSQVIRVETGRTLYHAGEPIAAEITSSVPTGALFVEVSRGYHSIASKVARLSRGRAMVSFPHRKEFEGEISINAYLIDSSGSRVEGSRVVLYPAGRELKLEARSRKEYRPGEEAGVNLMVRGAKEASALGVVVYDKAVEERARSDQEFGYGSGFLDWFRDEDERFGLIRRADLDKLDLTKPLPEGLELVAEVLLSDNSLWWLNAFGTEEYEMQIRPLFSRMLFWPMLRVRAALDLLHKDKNEHPSDIVSLKRLLADAGIDFDAMRDPWGTPYRAAFSIKEINDAMTIVSAGPDERFDTSDDFVALEEMRWPYFTALGKKIDRAIEGYHARMGKFIRDLATLESELKNASLNLSELKDRWGNRYRIEFGIEGVNFTVKFLSGGPNGRFEDESYGSDDFVIWNSRADYFAESRARIDAALAGFFKATSRFPQNDAEMGEALRIAGIGFDGLRDPWGNRFYATFKTESSYADRVTLQSYAVYGSQPEHRAEVVPVTRQIDFVTLRSPGPDGKEGSGDDFNAALFSRIVAERAARDSEKLPGSDFAFTGLAGAISGTVTDQTGAVIARASVKATHLSAGLVYQTKTDDRGEYIFWDLPTGIYELTFEASGFKKTIVTQVLVSMFDITKVDSSLYPGGLVEAVTVTAGSEATMTLQKESSQISVSRVDALPLKGGARLNLVTKSGLSLEQINVKAQISTPRLREYFPETLFWQPEIVTDKQGRAQIKFKLADNITTWKMAVIASTTDGHVATLEREIRAFQPFFIDHDPPRALTEGDEIALPVVLRNYLDRAQMVDAEIKPENWFALLGPAKKRINVAAGDAAREVFEFRAVAPVKEGRQQVIGYGAEMSDAIEKKISVRPNGEEIVQTASKVFNQTTAFDIAVPDSAIRGSIEGELRIYPNLISHVIESIEAIIERPNGCAEQTISSAYPSLLALRYYKQRREEFPAIAQKALRYARAGYERLLNYQNREGGFSYWGRGESDVALTAYALRFLEDASEVISVDEDVLRKARDWLVKQQSDGRWAFRWSDGSEDRRATALVTAFAARALARSRDKTKTVAAVKLALDYLQKRADEINEPYLLASLALAAESAGAKETASRAREKLRAAARNEGDGAYWSLESNTPFYGWGLTGRIETSALAMQALAAGARDDLADRGLLFLIRNKDRYGVWHSTQATINVLDAMLALLEKRDARSLAAPSQAEVFVNGRSVLSIDLPRELTGPVRIDLSKFLQTSMNHIEIKRGAGSMSATAQIVTTHYERWREASDAAVKMESLSALRLKVNFDKTEARAGDEIVCRVEVERAGFRGYGMMLAEVGLPPGADVDRASLDLAMKQSDWSLSRYDVLPDRVIVYLWPQANGARFEFKFRPRYGIRARSAPSTVYDYYNPEARATVAPVRFVVK